MRSEGLKAFYKSSSGSRFVVSRTARVDALVHYLNKYLSGVLFSHGGVWDITDKGEDGL